MLMRVLHVLAGNLYGGVETFLGSVARDRHLCPAMVPGFAVCFPGRIRDELLAANVSVHDLGPVRASRPWTVWRARRTLRHLLTGYELAVLHHAWAVGLFAPAAVRAGVPVVGYYHGPTGDGWADRLAGRRRVALVVAPSAHSLGLVTPRFPGVPAAVVHYPLPAGACGGDLPAEEREAIRSESGASPTDAVLLQASRLERWKGPDRVLSALLQLKDVPGWRFWFAGGPQRPDEHEYLAELKRLAEPIADRVRFLGARSDVPRLMRAADVYTQGNRGAEGFSLAFLEAAAAGLPIATSDLGGAADLIDPECGVLVPADDLAALTAGLRRLILDPGLRARMGAAARRKASETSDPGRQLGRLHELFAGALAAPARS